MKRKHDDGNEQWVNLAAGEAHLFSSSGKLCLLAGLFFPDSVKSSVWPSEFVHIKPYHCSTGAPCLTACQAGLGRLANFFFLEGKSWAIISKGKILCYDALLLWRTSASSESLGVSPPEIFCF